MRIKVSNVILTIYCCFVKTYAKRETCREIELTRGQKHHGTIFWGSNFTPGNNSRSVLGANYIRGNSLGVDSTEESFRATSNHTSSPLSTLMPGNIYFFSYFT